MVFGSLSSIALLFLSFSIKGFASIPCDFQFVEFDPAQTENMTSHFNLESLQAKSRSLPGESFSCDERDTIVPQPGTTKATETHQYIFLNPEDSDYEDIESTCQVSRRTIQPKALNNIYNQLTKVVNTASFIQSITIEQCLSKNEPCNSGTVPPSGKKHICRQKHVKITLKAFGEGDVIVDEQFYYPSHCVCELVRIKKKKVKKCSVVHRNKN